jgi:protein-disulfide isomerase
MKLKQFVTIGIIILGLLGGTAVGLWLSGKWQSPPSLSKASTGAQPAHTKGSENAVVTLEEFGDLQCPPCANLHEEIKLLQEEYGTKLRIVYRHFPLESHKHAVEAAQAAEAAALQGKFWEMQNLLFERQDEWSESNNVRQSFIGYARQLNLDEPKFVQDMDSPQVKERINSDKQRGDSVSISATPTLFVNGEEIASESMSAEGIRKAVDSAIR